MNLYASLFAVLLPLAQPPDGPFSDLSFEEAAARAKAAGTLLLVDFTAAWCAPCKEMEQQTWPTEVVAAWISAHAVAVRVDVDDAPDIARRFQVESIPTVVLLRDGDELDRHTGFLGPNDLVAWAAGVLEDASDPEHAEAELQLMLKSTDPRELCEAGTKLLRRKRFDEAAQALMESYRRSSRHDFIGNPLTTAMKSLVDQHSPSRETFGALVEEAAARVATATVPAYSDWWEWLNLCRITGRTADIVAWYDARCDAAGQLFADWTAEPARDVHVGPPFLPSDFTRDKTVPASPPLIRRQVAELLDEAGRTEEALAVLGDLVAHGRELLSSRGLEFIVAMSGPAERASVSQSVQQTRYFPVARLYALALAGGRDEQAEQVANLILSEDTGGGGRIALIMAAIDRGVGSRGELATWLEEAEKLGADTARWREVLEEDVALPRRAGG